MPDKMIEAFGQKMVRVVEDIGLVIILFATLIAAGQEIMHMVSIGTVHLADLLLMFIYLEVVAMVHAYWQSGQLPVRMPLYIAMVALARYMILDMKAMDEWRMLAIAGSVFILGAAVLIVRYGHVRFPYGTPDKK